MYVALLSIALWGGPLSAVAAGQLHPSVFPRRQFPVGHKPVSIRPLDLNLDGRVDLAVAKYFNGDTDGVSILINEGDGVFALARTYPTGGWPSKLVDGDFNGDGLVDLAVSNSSTQVPHVSVLLGSGGGVFTAPTFYSVGGKPYSMAAADVDGDGDIDLATANRDLHNVSILMNDGLGRFTLRAQISVGTTNGPVGIALGDLDSDGDVDMAVSAGQVWVLVNNGGGSFAAPIGYDVGLFPRGLVIGDLDNNATTDIAVVGNGSGAVSIASVLLNTGDGTFDVSEPYLVFGNYPEDVAAADIDGDGYLDLAVGNTLSQGVSVLRNLGDGTFAVGVVYTGGGSCVAMADVTGDEIPDLLAGSSRGWVILFDNQGDGTFPVPASLGFPVNGAGAVAVGDVNSDGTADLIIAELGSFKWRDDTIAVFANDGTSTYTLLGRFVVGYSPGALAAVDLNGDGSLDVAVAKQGYPPYWAANSAAVVLNNGDGTFGEAVSYALPSEAIGIGAADLNGDARPDLAVTLRNGTLALLFNAGDGDFLEPTLLSFPSSLSAAALGDLDLDGDSDLALSTWGGALYVLFNDGQGNFDAPFSYPCAPQCATVTIGDLNGDGAPDLAAVVSTSGVLARFNRGDGTFRRSALYAFKEWRPQSVQVADLDSDGDADLIGRDYMSGYWVLFNEGAAIFQELHHYAADSASFTVADLNQDGYLDLTARTTLYLNLGTRPDREPD